MRAQLGDWLIVHSHVENRPIRRGQIVGAGPDGSPPFAVRWTEDDHVSTVFPGPDAEVVHATELAEHDDAELARVERVQEAIAKEERDGSRPDGG